VFIPLHWGIDGFMSPKQFETFYWPQLRKLIHMVIDAGLTPQPFFEGECTTRLETIADVPPGKCTYMFESSDFNKAKEILGDIVCIRGGMPASLLISGSPGEVEAHAKTLIDTIGKGGGYIMDASSAGIPREARFDNVRAMFDTVKTYGVY
jgi:uroporphyrinogen-III decarboxylase